MVNKVNGVVTSTASETTHRQFHAHFVHVKVESSVPTGEGGPKIKTGSMDHFLRLEEPSRTDEIESDMMPLQLVIVNNLTVDGTGDDDGGSSGNVVNY